MRTEREHIYRSIHLLGELHDPRLAISAVVCIENQSYDIITHDYAWSIGYNGHIYTNACIGQIPIQMCIYKNSLGAYTCHAKKHSDLIYSTK